MKKIFALCQRKYASYGIKISMGVISSICIIFFLSSMITMEPLKAASGLKIYNYTEKKERIYTGKTIKVSYKGTKLSSERSPVISLNKVEMLPSYDIFAKSKIGATYGYNKTKGTITIKKNGNSISMTLGRKEATVNGYKMTMPAAPVLIKFIKSKTTKVMVPAQFVIEVLGYGYELSSNKGEIVIKTDLYGNTPGNISQGGKFIYHDGWIYTTEFDFYLFRMKPDGSKKQMIDSISKPESLNFKDGYLYYYSEGNLYRSTLEGKKITKIKNSQGIRKFIVFDKYIYYINHSDYGIIYRMNLDGSGKKKLSTVKECISLNITNKYVFYSTNKGLYRMNIDGSEKLKLSSTGAEDIVSDNKYIYYIKRNYYSDIVRSRYDGTEAIKLSDYALNLNIYNNTLYYQNGSDNSKLYAITTEGRAKTKVTDKATYSPNIVNGYIYYIIEDDHNDGKLHRVKLNPIVVDQPIPSSVMGNYTGNIINSAFTAYNNSNIYFSYHKLYRAPASYTNSSSFKEYNYKDYRAFYQINIVGEYIYCTMTNRDFNVSGGIYKIKKDWSQAPVRLTDLNADCLTVIGDWMYFTDYNLSNLYEGSGPIYKMRTDGSALTSINSKINGARCLNITSDYIYFINEKDQNSIYRMKLDGSDLKRLSADNEIYTFQVYGEDIYYRNLNNRSIMTMSKEGGPGAIIMPKVDFKMIVYLDRIYYFQYSNDGTGYSLYSCKLNGSDIVKLKSQVSTDDINITAGYVYFKNNNYAISRIKLHDIQAN